VLSAFAFQAIGALVGTVVGFLILSNLPEIGRGAGCTPPPSCRPSWSVLGRLKISDSGHWLMSQGRKAEAEAEVARLLEREPPYPKEVRLADLPADEQAAAARVRRDGGWRDLFARPAGAPPSSPRCRGSCRISAPTASASSRPPSWSRTIGHEDSSAQHSAP
jgi:hypothetical protein